MTNNHAKTNHKSDSFNSGDSISPIKLNSISPPCLHDLTNPTTVHNGNGCYAAQGKDMSLIELWNTTSPITLNNDEQDYVDFTKTYRNYDEEMRKLN